MFSKYSQTSALDSSLGRMSNMRQTSPFNIYEQQIMRQYQQPQPQQSNPYEDFKNIIGSCDESVKNGIFSDPQYQEINNHCERLIQTYMYNQMVPMVLQDPAGYDAFAKLVNTAKQLKQTYEAQAKNQVDELQKQLLLTQQELAAMKQEKGGVEIAPNDNESTSTTKSNRTGNRKSVQGDTSKS